MKLTPLDEADASRRRPAYTWRRRLVLALLAPAPQLNAGCSADLRAPSWSQEPGRHWNARLHFMKLVAEGATKPTQNEEGS